MIAPRVAYHRASLYNADMLVVSGDHPVSASNGVQHGFGFAKWH
jgi:hypothetical protein